MDHDFKLAVQGTWKSVIHHNIWQESFMQQSEILVNKYS